MRSADDRPTSESSHSSSLSGSARDVVQARDISGDVHFHVAGGREPHLAPRQLPADTAVLLGRDREIEELLDLAASAEGRLRGTVVISAIDGMAGIGKSALAIHVSHRLASRFPDGQLFVDLRGFTQGLPPRDPADVLTSFLLACGVPPQQIPADVDERAALYRARLAETRTLVLLDNAAAETQVLPLLPGDTGCLVLVTSRKRLRALTDAHSVSIDILSIADAIELIRKIAGTPALQADAAALAAIAEVCGRLPLTLRIAAALWRHRPAWPPDHLLQQLRRWQPVLQDFSDGTQSVSGVFDLSLRSIAPEGQVLYGRLGLLPGPDTDVLAAAALLDGDTPTAERLLQYLVDHSLLMELTPGRYTMHDLVRAHARAISAIDPEDHREAALDRLLAYYAYTAQSASSFISRLPRRGPSGPPPAHTADIHDADAAWAWLVNERANLDAAFDHASSQGLHRRTVALGDGMAEILRDNGSWTRAIAVHTAAASAADRLGDRLSQADALSELGRMRRVTGDFPGAADALALALDAYEKLSDPLGQANTLARLGRVQRMIGKFPAAADTLTQAQEIYRQLGDPLGEATALVELADVRQMVGELSASAEACAQAHQIYKELGHTLAQAMARTRLARLYSITGDLPAALDALTWALETSQRLGARTEEADALAELGRVQYLAGEISSASETLSRAAELYGELNDRHGQAGALTDLGTIRRISGDLPGASNALLTALDTFRQLGDRSNEARALNHYAAVVFENGDLTQALSLYSDALQMNRELGKPGDEGQSLEGIFECLNASDRSEDGIAHLYQALEIFERLGLTRDAERATARLRDLQTR